MRSGKKFRPPDPFAKPPQAFVSLPKLQPGQKWMQVKAVEKEDAEEVTKRVSSYAWASKIVGRPTRVGNFWMFRLEGP